MPIDHSEHDNLTASGLSTIVERLDSILNSSVWRAAATNAASLKQAIIAQSLLVHECDKGGFQTAARMVDTMYNIGQLTDAQVAAMNDQATSRAAFTDDDQTLIGANNGNPHRFGASR